MLSASLEIGMIGYIGGTPLIVSDFFSNKFGCNSLNLPSTKIEGNLSKHIASARFIYGSFPKSFRRPVSYAYRYYRKNRRTIFPQINGELEQLSKEENKGVLLVDDNTYTGRTMEFWKREILNIQGIVPKTFAITTELITELEASIFRDIIHPWHGPKRPPARDKSASSPRWAAASPTASRSRWK